MPLLHCGMSPQCRTARLRGLHPFLSVCRAILWSAHQENALYQWYSDNYHAEVHAFVESGRFCVVNNTYEPQSTTVYRGDGSSFPLELAANEIRWYEVPSGT